MADQKKDIIAKKVEAKKLLVVNGWSQKEIAQKVGISEKTMSKWVKDFNWNDQRENTIEDKAGIQAYYEGFFQFVDKEAPEIPKRLNKLWEDYQQQLKDKKDIEE